MKTETEIIKRCLKGDEKAYSTLYKLFASKMMLVCLRYASSTDEAKDLLQEGFIRVFQHLYQYKGEGSLEGWIRKIMVNVSLEFYRKKNTNYTSIDLQLESNTYNALVSTEDILSKLQAEELLTLVQKLPPTYRLVFNLYEFEGYKHHEIAQKLGITEGTSKSNLHDARRILQRWVTQLMDNTKK